MDNSIGTSSIILILCLSPCLLHLCPAYPHISALLHIFVLFVCTNPPIALHSRESTLPSRIRHEFLTTVSGSWLLVYWCFAEFVAPQSILCMLIALLIYPLSRSYPWVVFLQPIVLPVAMFTHMGPGDQVYMVSFHIRLLSCHMEAEPVPNRFSLCAQPLPPYAFWPYPFSSVIFVHGPVCCDHDPACEPFSR